MFARRIFRRPSRRVESGVTEIVHSDQGLSADPVLNARPKTPETGISTDGGIERRRGCCGCLFPRKSRKVNPTVFRPTDQEIAVKSDQKPKTQPASILRISLKFAHAMTDLRRLVKGKRRPESNEDLASSTAEEGEDEADEQQDDIAPVQAEVSETRTMNEDHSSPLKEETIEDLLAELMAPMNLGSTTSLRRSETSRNLSIVDDISSVASNEERWTYQLEPEELDDPMRTPSSRISWAASDEIRQIPSDEEDDIAPVTTPTPTPPAPPPSPTPLPPQEPDDEEPISWCCCFLFQSQRHRPK